MGIGKQIRVNLKRLTTVVVGIICLIFTAVIPVQAATTQTSAVANGFQISPVLSELTINKGQSQTAEVTVTNPTNVVSNAQVVVDDFTASSDESGTPKLLLYGQVANPRQNFKTLVSPIPNITIPPKGTTIINVTLTVPATANSGGYYGVIRLIQVASSNSAGNVGLTASVGTLFLVTVPGNLTEKLDLIQLSAARNSQASSLIVSGTPQVLTRLDNVGDIHVQPFGKVTIKDTFGKVVASFEFNNTDPRGNVLPNSIRKFINNLPNRTWLGHYTISESLGYTSGGGNLIIASAGFWYLPIWLISLLAIVVILIVAMIYWLLIHRRRPVQHRR